MTTDAEEIRYSTMTRIAGQSENYAQDVEPECGLNRAAVSSVERGASIATAALTVGVSAVALRVGASNLTNRRGILIQNKGTSVIYVGGSTVTTATGVEIAVSAALWLAVSESQTLYGISGTADQNVRILEMG